MCGSSTRYHMDKADSRKSSGDQHNEQKALLKFLICSDSKSMCDALKQNNWKDRDPWLKKIKEEMYQLEVDTTLLWIPSHCDVDGNEQADELAKRGTTKSQDGIPVTHNIMKAKIKGRKWEVSHARALETYGDRRGPKMEVERPWPRSRRTLFARLRTGHAMELKAYRHKIEKEDDPNCEHCGVPETIEHVLCKCSALDEARARNWEGEVTIQMMVEEPEVCRKILSSRFPTLKATKKDVESRDGETAAV